VKVKNTFIILIFFIILPHCNIYSAVTAHFTMSASEGCSPLIITFTNQSTTGLSIKYVWDLGIGGPVYTKDPQSTYTTPGQYIVSLLVTDTVSSESATFSDTVTVFHSPTANFSAIQKGCVPYNAQFHDLSQAGDAAITEWFWDFRGGVTDARQNPNYNYTIVGTHDVFLEVTDANGCKGSVNRLNYIDVVMPPHAGFSISPASACKIPATIAFTNSSTGTDLAYNWSFGDGKVSTVKNPSNQYTAFGNYNIKLVSSSSYGCKDSITHSLNIAAINAVGTLSQGGVNITNNAIICPGIVAYASTSVGTASIKWVFGDGTTSTSTSGNHNYSISGNYKALLIASPGTSCADTVSWNFTVESIAANFSMNPATSCLSPLNVIFTDLSTNPNTWEWTFDGGSKAYTKNTTHVYSVPPETDPYMINIEYTFNTILKVTSTHGCVASTSKILRIKKPTAIHSVDTVSGCKPLKVKFSDKSLSDLPIISRRWLFDDGMITTTTDTISHQYLNAGVFHTKLVITNSGGCTDTSYAITVGVGKVLSPDFSVSPSSACPNEQIQFIDNTPEASLIQGWHYFIDGKSIESAPNISSPYWNVKSDTGFNDVQLTVNYNGCISQSVKQNVLFNKGPVAGFDNALSCNTPFDYNFSNTSKEADSYEWTFGDGSPSDNAANPSHHYSTENNFSVVLVTTKNACKDTATKEIKVRATNTVITADTSSCKATPVLLNGKASYTSVDYCFEKYYWDFNGIFPNIRTNIDSVSVSFPDRGNYAVKLKTTYDNGCVDSATKFIRIFQPYVGFKADTLNGCSPFEVNFTDTSYADAHPLTKWTWDFDDTTSNLVYTTVTNPINHLFSDPGEYHVTLTVLDGIGCEGTNTLTVATANPNAQFTSPDPKGCVNEKMILTYTYPSPDSAIWNFGDGTIVHDTTNPISHAYHNKGSYPVQLILFKNACPDTFVSPLNYVEIQKADASFNLSDSVWNCYPKQIELSYVQTDPVIPDLSKWEFGYNNNVGVYNDNVVFTYPLPGHYTPRLIIQTNFGCKDTASRSIDITGPTGTFNITPDIACSGDMISFNIIDTNSVFDFEWDMGNGTFKQGNPVHYTYPFTTYGAIYPKLILFGDSIINSNNVCVVAIEDTLYISIIKANFDYADSALCDQYDIFFHNLSDSSIINNWDFGNGLKSTDADPVEKFSPGTYVVELIATNAYSCSDTMLKDITIHSLPSIQVSKDTFICLGKGIIISAQGGDAITWTPSVGLSNQHSYNPTASPDYTTIYKAIVIDNTTHCRNSDSLKLSVQQHSKIKIVLMTPGDTLTQDPYIDPFIDTLIVGETAKIIADSSKEYSYVWSPDYNLSCIKCASVSVQPLKSTDYLLNVSDTNGCFTDPYNISLIVKEQYSLVLPTAFTPNGDDFNAKIFVNGSGIKELIEFRVFNRWGNEVFFTNDINQGWDGTYKGKLQNIDSYAYTVKALMWDGQVRTIKGTFNLLR
jgi:gliding motility-associated-like protein